MCAQRSTYIVIVIDESNPNLDGAYNASGIDVPYRRLGYFQIIRRGRSDRTQLDLIARRDVTTLRRVSRRRFSLGSLKIRKSNMLSLLLDRLGWHACRAPCTLPGQTDRIGKVSSNRRRPFPDLSPSTARRSSANREATPPRTARCNTLVKDA